MREYEKYKIAKDYLKKYVKENNISDICLLFNKDTLIEFSYDSDWEWSIKDEQEFYGCSEKEAIEKNKKMVYVNV